jgi:hypothetical protein
MEKQIRIPIFLYKYDKAIQFLKKNYSDQNIIGSTTLQLQELRLGKSFDNYANKFQALASRLTADPKILCIWFRKGLPLWVKSHMSLLDTTTLGAYINDAHKIYQANYVARTPGGDPAEGRQAGTGTRGNGNPFLPRKIFDER